MFRKVKKKEVATKETLPILKENEQILYYVSGYIIFSLIEKYKGIINNNEKKYCCKRCLEFFNYLKTTCSEKIVGMLLEYYAEISIEITDGGNLVKVNEEYYIILI